MTRESTSAFRHPNFAWFWTGQSASVAGNGIFRVALPLEVLRLTGNPFDLALVLAVDQIPTVLFLLIGGALVDRMSRRKIMLVSDVANGTVVLAVTLLIASGQVRLWHLLLLALVSGVATAVYLPAAGAIVPELVPASLLAPANSLMLLSQSLGQFLIGPLCGGILVALAGTGWAFGVDGVSYLISAGCLALLRNLPPLAPVEENSTVFNEVLVGVRYSRSRRWLWWNMLAMGAGNLAAYLPLFVVLPLLVKDVFKADSMGLGLVYAASGVGGAVASLYVKRKKPPARILAGMWVAMACGSVSVCLLGASPMLWLAIVFSATMWAGVTYGNILWFTVLQERVPPELLGRVMSLDLLLSVAMGPVGFFLGGVGSHWIGPRATLIYGGLVATAAALVAFVPRVLEPDDPPVAPQPESEPSELATS
ncbi:MAG TPA: MFS transporter [Jatrophihabitans sp.]|nr:MFS transporter [Jatrophihabitans sp.]